MKTNTPPMSPGPSDDNEDDENIDLGEIQEVIDLNEVNLEEMTEEEDMEEEETIVDMATTVFSKHEGSVFTCSISPSGSVAATGGEDDFAYVWKVSDGDILFTCTGHKDSVIYVCFSHDGTLLATGDYAGYIQVWEVASSNKVWEFEVGELGWLNWHHASHVLLAGTADGEMWMWLVPHGNTRTFPSYGSPSLCGAFLHDGKRAVAGYEDGSVRVFDLKSGQMLHQLTDDSEDVSPVINMTVQKDDSLVILGATNGKAKLFNTNNGKLVGNLNCEISQTTEEGADADIDNTVEAVSFCPQIPNIAVTATLAGYVTLWDVSSKTVRHTLSQGCGTSHLAWHPQEPVLFSAGLDGVVRSYDVRSGEPLSKFTGHSESILYLSVSNDGSALLTVSDDGTARVFKLS
ncbi:angio-associated migratory cell protein-like [Portunus trituberculatus]|uniref:angio-associated migratory cell protein-like n=1 Tax=Portunus trituberculatus TaxID=210409 RepID=UPI001E1CB960|nr:angio-associated migratory cell protein-like [Portunus trituberculatus]XP_045111304.1 angio-associated migratory cell protein-like [Portunus trituberculatus]XP_045111305.1 angio-associated migratory cell protein-like [Portunus trituberculatus]